MATALVVLSFSGCGKTTVAAEAETSYKGISTSSALAQSINVGCFEDDSLNPFFMTSELNTDLISLVFEPLFTIDDTFAAQPDVAESYVASKGMLTVKLNQTAVFSDGVQISSADVVYSFNMAKKSDAYKSEILNISSATASGADSVIFSISGNENNAVDSLNFPIVKNATAPDANAAPIGTGMYKYSVSGDSKILTYNPYCRKPEPNITTVKLVNVPTTSTLVHTLEMGVINAYFDDLSLGSYSQPTASTTRTNLTNLIFLGMNSDSYGLSSAAVRQAIFFSVNRQSVVKNAFKNFAVESYTPFHPEWHVFSASKYDVSGFSLDYSKAQTLMANAGFTEPLSYKLIVYSGNSFKIAAANEIAANLANIGIKLIISELTWDEYTEALTEGQYDFYIGEIKLSANMDMSSLFGDKSILYGVSENDTAAAAYSEYSAGNITINAFTDSFLQNMSFVPVCFRMGVLVYSNKISPAADCDYNNAYKNIYEWNMEVSQEAQSESQTYSAANSLKN